MPQDQSIRPARLLGLGALVALGLGCFWVMRPFISALLWAVILAYTTWPAFRILRERTGLGPGKAAAIMVILEFVLIGLPLVFATPTTREEIEGLRNSVESLLLTGLPSLAAWLGRLPFVGEYVTTLLMGWDSTFAGLFDTISPYAGEIASNALAVLLALLSGLAELLMAIFLAFFFYRDGPAMAAHAERVMEKMAGPGTRRLILLTGNVTRGVVYGLLGTAVVQGAMTVFGLWIAGVPQPVLLGVVAGVLSILPVGAPLVWIPATIWLFTQGETGWGLFMLVYGAAGISSVDNVIRPWLISRGADLPLLLTLLGAIGGVIGFGILGLFLGPVLLAVGFTLLREWAADGTAIPRGPDGA
ncbi:AI-2E family transporter [Falsiroseomonas selenitidurans]|uniref:AI-2E family transporter n=1 Tax=Falsiroseomonas selenitidurans TaxID=2716335 RepID=A0ABX1DWL7_9PROT|nr:AI-2E family transporter [Falsiroseomonas selenitidurans]NKC29297.1 AI-2E family transporter [Falsiroseomonas selenitidurans]